MDTQWVVVGLGNPGNEYANTRHNIGRSIVEYYQEHTPHASAQVVIPDSYMNLSGGPVAKAMRGRDIHTLIVVHDDIDLPFGEVKISMGKGSGGQKGVEDIIKALGSNEFIRLRVGIAPVFLGVMRKPQGEGAVARFVLKQFGVLERLALPGVLTSATQAITDIIEKGALKAMNTYN